MFVIRICSGVAFGETLDGYASVKGAVADLLPMILEDEGPMVYVVTPVGEHDALAVVVSGKTFQATDLMYSARVQVTNALTGRSEKFDVTYFSKLDEAGETVHDRSEVVRLGDPREDSMNHGLRILFGE